MRERDFIAEFLQENCAYLQEKYEGRSLLTMAAKSNPSDLVTEVDLTLQKRFEARLAEQFPEDALMAEEGAHAAPPASRKGRCWIVDPVDGTNNFVRGLFPFFGVSVAFAQGGVVEAAGVYALTPHTLYTATRGGGAFAGGHKLQVSRIQDLAEARVEVEFGWTSQREETLARTHRVLCAAGQVRACGSAVIGFCQIAGGDMDAYVHVGLAPWDFAACMLLVEEAGGMVTGLEGRPLDLFAPRQPVLMSNGAIHHDLLKLLG